MNPLRRHFFGGLAGLGAAGLGSAAQTPASRSPLAAPAMPGGLDQLFWARKSRRRREASWDRTGKNSDRVPVAPGETHTLADIRGAGCIRHIWITVANEDPDYLRRVVLRCYWDGETNPSVESPLGDFFGVGHAKASNYWSLPLNMVTGAGAQRGNRAAMNSFFPMPYARGARITVENQGKGALRSFYYYVDYESFDTLPEEALRFHAQWRRENPTRASLQNTDRAAFKAKVPQTANLDGELNYVLMEATGRGHYAGCVLSIDHVNPLPDVGWFGEGDDMFYIDGEKTPSIVGTGTEDYFCAAWGYPGGFVSMPYHGISYQGSPVEGPGQYSGKWTMYRFHIEDPVMFEKSIKVTIEHGPGNVQANDYSSTAYWYQTEPHAVFPALLPVDKRIPIPDAESLRQYWKTF